MDADWRRCDVRGFLGNVAGPTHTGRTVSAMDQPSSGYEVQYTSGLVLMRVWWGGVVVHDVGRTMDLCLSGASTSGSSDVRARSDVQIRHHVQIPPGKE